MSSLSFHDKQHILRLLIQQKQVKSIFDNFVRRSGLVLTQWTEKNANNVWVRNSVLENQIDKLLTGLHDDLLINIDNHTVQAWEAANIKTDDLLKKYIKDLALSEIIGKSRFEKLERGMFARNMEALKAFQNRKIDGFNVSDRIWKATEGAKENLEYYLSSGISTGRPATTIASDIRQLLENPDKRFRRIKVKDSKGKEKFVMSKPMQDYHPGQGQYRSSYMNALRVAATETNQAYHTADHERWKDQGFVLGIEVHRSKSNKGPCPICDPMVGKYPPDYKFIGNHPWCVCFAVPIMLEGEEFTDYLLTGEIPQDKIIKDIPQSAKNWVNGKASRSNELFVKENRRYFGEAEDKSVKEYVFDADKLKERGFHISGVDPAEYKDQMGDFNLDTLDDDMTKLAEKYGFEIKSKHISSYFGEFKIDYEGENNFRMTRSFSGSTVYHDVLTIPTKLQGKGLSKEILRSLYTQYQNAGIKEIQVVANMDIGGYAWAKYGFRAKADRYDDLMAWARFQMNDKAISKTDFINFEEWITNFKGKDIPMYEIAERKYGKNLLMGSAWRGSIDLTDKAQTAIFEAYLNKSK